MKKLLTVLLALAMAFTMVFATAASAEDGYKDSITWVIGNDQDILDPQNNVSNSKVIPQYYDGLLGYDNDGNVVCKMAESYEASEDKMTWTFHLRQDVDVPPASGRVLPLRPSLHRSRLRGDV